MPQFIQPHILLVDDERAFSDSLCELLELRGFKVSRAYDGRSALDAFLSDKPDAVSMDTDLGDSLGYDICRMMSNIYPDIPVIGNSSHASTEHIGGDTSTLERRWRVSGGYAFIEKAALAGRLPNTLREAIAAYSEPQRAYSCGR